MDTQRALRQLIAQEQEKQKQSAHTVKLQKLQKKIEEKRSMLASLYTDFREGILTQDEYLYAKGTYRAELEKLEQEESEWKQAQEKAEYVCEGEKKWAALIDQYYHAKQLTKPMVEAFVQSIKLYSDNSIEIEFRYKNEFEELLRECERIRKVVA